MKTVKNASSAAWIEQDPLSIKQISSSAGYIHHLNQPKWLKIIKKAAPHKCSGWKVFAVQVPSIQLMV